MKESSKKIAPTNRTANMKDTNISEIEPDYKKLYIKYHNLLLKYYRKKYSKYIPFRKIYNIIQKKWQLIKYKLNEDDIISKLNNLKIKEYKSTIRWRNNIEETRFYISK
jgi:hypothetical protein